MFPYPLYRLSCKSFIHECRKHTIYACHNAKHLQLWPDTVNKKSADSLYSLQMTWFTDPYKNVFKKIHQKFHEKAIQSNILWLNLNKICGISILQSAHKQCQASFHFHVPGSKRRYSHALKQHRLSQNSPSPSVHFLYWLSHLTCISSLKAKNDRKTLIYTLLKISRYNQHFFAIFRPILIK